MTNVTLETNLGNITLKLDAESTPVTSQNFINYVQEGFYDNTIFHRVISNFMIQGGGFTEQMTQKKTNAPIENEADKSTLKNSRGTIAMARTQDPHSATAQFFINVTDNSFLNFRGKDINGWGYCVFGEVTEGMDVVDNIKAVATQSSHGHDDVPVAAVIIKKAFIVNEA